MGKFDNIKFNKKHYKNIAGDDLADIPAGFCTNRTHIGYLTENNVRNHECIARQCQYLIKNEKHPMWAKQREKKIKRTYFQFIEKLFYDNKINKEKYNKLKKIDKISYMESFVLTNNERIKEETMKGKIFLFRIVKEIKEVENITQQELAKKVFGNDIGKTKKFWCELAKTINDEKYDTIGKRTATIIQRYREAIYRSIIIGQDRYIYGKGIRKEYGDEIIKKGLLVKC